MLISFSKCETAAQACPDPLAQRPLSACLSADANINVPGAAYLGGSCVLCLDLFAGLLALGRQPALPQKWRSWLWRGGLQAG